MKNLINQKLLFITIVCLFACNSEPNTDSYALKIKKREDLLAKQRIQFNAPLDINKSPYYTFQIRDEIRKNNSIILNDYDLVDVDQVDSGYLFHITNEGYPLYNFDLFCDSNTFLKISPILDSPSIPPSNRFNILLEISKVEKSTYDSTDLKINIKGNIKKILPVL